MVFQMAFLFLFRTKKAAETIPTNHKFSTIRNNRGTTKGCPRVAKYISQVGVGNVTLSL
jgi:hypothetical protein